MAGVTLQEPRAFTTRPTHLLKPDDLTRWGGDGGGGGGALSSGERWGTGGTPASIESSLTNNSMAGF